MWHNSLTKANKQDLEKVQKSALKVILRSEYVNHENAFKLSGLESLEERRDMMNLKFAETAKYL